MVTAGFASLTWNAPRGCGFPEDYAIYEETTGDWTSHVLVTCSATQSVTCP